MGKDQPVCEFCLELLGNVTPWTYVLTEPLRVEVPKAFSQGTTTWDGDTDGLWCICGACHKDIQAGATAALVERSLAVDPVGHVPVVRIWKERVVGRLLETIDVFYRGTPWDRVRDGQRRTK